MDHLTITADREEYQVGLTCHASIDGFTGYGEGWFNNSKIKSLAHDLIILSKHMVGKVELIGGQSKADGSEYLETFGMRFYLLGKSSINGVVGIHVTLASPFQTYCTAEEVLKMSGQLKTRNHNLKKFSNDLIELLAGKISEVSLECME